MNREGYLEFNGILGPGKAVWVIRTHGNLIAVALRSICKVQCTVLVESYPVNGFGICWNGSRAENHLRYLGLDVERFERVSKVINKSTDSMHRQRCIEEFQVTVKASIL